MRLNIVVLDIPQAWDASISPKGVCSIVYNMRDRIAEIDKVVADEANRIKSFKESRSSSS